MSDELKIHQIDIALIQLERACELFFLEDFISALTLAGAAEEILGSIAENESKNALGRSKDEIGINAFTMQASLMIDLVGGDYGSYKQKRNHLRNSLKHPMNNYVVNLTDIEIKVVQIIGDAITNYKLIFSSLPNLPMIKKFCEQVGVN